MKKLVLMSASLLVFIGITSAIAQVRPRPSGRPAVVNVDRQIKLELSQLNLSVQQSLIYLDPARKRQVLSQLKSLNQIVAGHIEYPPQPIPQSYPPPRPSGPSSVDYSSASSYYNMSDQDLLSYATQGIGACILSEGYEGDGNSCHHYVKIRSSLNGILKGFDGYQGCVVRKEDMDFFNSRYQALNKMRELLGRGECRI